MKDSLKKRAVILEANAKVRGWLVDLINRQSTLEVCGDASNPAAAIRLIGSTKADVAILDIPKNGVAGAALIRRILSRHPGLVVIVLSLDKEMSEAGESRARAAHHDVMGQAASQKVIQAVRSVLDGKLCLINEIAGALAGATDGGVDAVAPGFPIDLIRGTEIEAFRLLGCGYSARRAAQLMRISTQTFLSLRRRIQEKLKLRSPKELQREARLWRGRQDAKRFRRARGKRTAVLSVIK